MRKVNRLLTIITALLICLGWGYANGPGESMAHSPRTVVASDTILSTMIASLLPPDRYVIETILPPGQCPGHYDVKLSDIEKMKKADLIVSFKGMPHMADTPPGAGGQILVDAKGLNWMAPESYMRGLGLIADRLSEAFPGDKGSIMRRKAETQARIESKALSLKGEIARAGLSGKAVIASSMQKEPLEWMGLRVVAEYGRPEAMSVREVVRLAGIGKKNRAVLVVDNMQSGPDAGRGIAETLAVPHVTLTNFPSEKGYLATVEENVKTVLKVLRK
jgi:zinc transport system substrate-binding protein